MTTNPDGKVAVRNTVELDLTVEELETIAAPAVATSPGPVFGGLLNHNETMISDPALELEENYAPTGVIVFGPFGSKGNNLAQAGQALLPAGFFATKTIEKETNMFRHYRLIGIISMLLLFLSSEAAAQEVSSFAQLQSLVRTGDKAILTDTHGMTIKGAISDVSPSLLRMKVQGKTVEWREDEVRRIDKRRTDRWWDWLLIGAGIGAASAYITAEISNNDSYKDIWVPWGTGIGAATGFLIDLAKQKSDTVFKAPTRTSDYGIRWSPILNKESKGAALAFTF